MLISLKSRDDMVILLTLNFDQLFTDSTYKRIRQLIASKVFCLLPVHIPEPDTIHGYLLMMIGHDTNMSTHGNIYILDPLTGSLMSKMHFKKTMKPFISKVFNHSSNTKYISEFLKVPGKTNSFDFGNYPI